MKRDRKKGFTLVELIVVLVILAIVSAISIPALTGYIDKSKEKQCRTRREALVGRLEEERAFNASATMQTVLAGLSGEDEELQTCPVTGNAYKAENDNAVTCDEHGTSATLSDGTNLQSARTLTTTSVTAKTETGNNNNSNDNNNNNNETPSGGGSSESGGTPETSGSSESGGTPETDASGPQSLTTGNEWGTSDLNNMQLGSTTRTMKVGTTEVLTLQFNPSTTKYQIVNWTNSDASVATLTLKEATQGYIYMNINALKVGTTQIECSNPYYNNMKPSSGTVTVNVEYWPVTGVEIHTSEEKTDNQSDPIMLTEGQTLQLVPKFLSEGQCEEVGTWNIEQGGTYASIDSNGLLYGLQESGYNYVEVKFRANNGSEKRRKIIVSKASE